ncbi:hypothetical protein LMG26854_06157 [Achromobacter aegrifaciens]|nr:hypothetical protein LMG26854_06157 [Achromobacter aegrifaciens]
MDRRAKGPAHAQLAAVHLRVDAQPRPAPAAGSTLLSRALASQPPYRVNTEALIDPTEIVERDLRIGAIGKHTPLVSKVAQHAVADPLVRHLPQLLLDCFQAAARAPIRFPARISRRQTYRIQRGEPARGSAQVHAIEKLLLPTMALEFDQDMFAPIPGAQGARQGCQQDVVDARAVGLRHIGQEQLRARLTQRGNERARVGHRVAAVRDTGQRLFRSPNDALPIGQFVAQLGAIGIACQRCGPIPQ